MRNRQLTVTLIAVLTASTVPPLLAQQPPKFPQNARELAIMRSYYDKTVWAKEVMAQDYENAVVMLWDKLIQPTDKYEALATAKFQQLKLGKQPVSETLDWEIQRTKFTGESTVPHSQWRALLESFRAQGYEIVETEWHHSEFVPPQDGEPARSVVSTSIYAKHEESNTRFTIKGDLHIAWSAQRDPETKVYQPSTVDATRMTVLSRTGDDVFQRQRIETLQLDPTGREFPQEIHPIIVQDLNRDLLPEVYVAGANKVFWNRGDWQFEADQLCAFPTKHVNAGLFGDFNGDGTLDFLCAVKQGFPKLYLGDSEGAFSAPPRELRIAPQRLVNPVAITAGDIDGDGDLDVFIGQNRVGYQTGEIPTPYFDARDSFPSFLLENDGQGEFRDVTLFSGLRGKHTRRNFSSSFVDLDADGDLDLLMTNDFAGNDLFLNDGGGVFQDVSNQLKPRSYGHGMSHSFGDYNLDGRLDFFFVAMSSTTARRLDKLQLGRTDFSEHNQQRKNMGYGNRMYLGSAEGFVQAPFNASVARTGWSWGSTTLDFDRDGDPDIYVANGQTSGKTTRDYCTRYWCHDLYYQSDNRPAAAISEFFSKLAPLFSGESLSWNGFEHNALLMNQGGSDFVNVGFLMNCGSVLDSRMTVSGDLDLDGRVDLVFEHIEPSTSRTHLHFLKNNWTDSHHWVGVHLLPTESLSPYGARVTVHLSDGRVLTQQFVSGHSVWAQHPNTLHFGMGECDQVQKMVIRWQDGKETLMFEPAVDQYHVARAGQ